MDIKQWLEKKKQERIERNTFIQIDTGEETIEAKMKDFHLVYIVDKKTGEPEFRLCGIRSEQIGIMLVGKVLVPQYYHYYVDLLDNNKHLDCEKYNVGYSYYLTSVIPMECIACKNYRLNREDLIKAFGQTQQQVLRKEKTFK